MKNENEKGNKLLEAIGGIDEKFVENAVNKSQASENAERNNGLKSGYMKFVAIAAACVILITTGALLLPGLFKRSGDPDNNGPGNNTDPGQLVASEGTVDLMEGIDVSGAAISTPTGEMLTRATDFAFKLFKACYSGKNTLISPLSVSAALGMTLNGAKGSTLAGMEETLGMSRDMLNEYISYVTKNLEGDDTLAIANSIWFRDRFIDGTPFNVYNDFLNTNAQYYRASLYKAPFDMSTVADINNWVNEKTHEMIPTLLDPEQAIDDYVHMYLINALAFNGTWEEAFDPEKTFSGKFTKEDGTKETADFMQSHGSGNLILHNDDCIGFAKYYEGEKYAFVALLPHEGSTVSELVSKLDGDTFNNLLKNSYKSEMDILIPKFETEYSTNLNQVLSSMGMAEAFLEDADFSGISDHKPLFIGSVDHKTFMSVDEYGTKAAAVTAVAITDFASYFIPLNRPFVYMLVDMTTGVPFFTGAMMSME